jgi:flagellin
MTSILTNTGAMTALQTLRGINQNLAQTQNEISTGKSIASAKDNSAIWAISKVMESDVAGFQAIKSSLSLGESSVAVARNATEAITKALTDIKSKIVAAQEENVDRGKIQTDIGQIRGQINSIVNAAQFNGLNLLQGFDDVSILSSLDRAADGTVTSSSISVDRQDMTSARGALGTGAGLTNLATNITASSLTLSSAAVRDNGAATPVPADIAMSGNFSGDALSFSINGTTIAFGVGELSATPGTAAQTIADRINSAQIEGISVTNAGGTLQFASTLNFDAATVTVTQTGSGGTLGATSVTMAARAESFTFANAVVNEGDGYQLALSGGDTAVYVAGPGETMEDVVRGLKASLDGEGNGDLATRVTRVNDQWVLQIANEGATAQTATITANNDANNNAVVTGGLAGLAGIDVRTDAGARAALSNIEAMIQTAIDASAAFGSAQSRVETQSEFVSKLTDSLKAGIGTMVDADLEEASARLQALQVQQQLGIQSLSIANQAPQTVLSLFR